MDDEGDEDLDVGEGEEGQGQEEGQGEDELVVTQQEEAAINRVRLQ